MSDTAMIRPVLACIACLACLAPPRVEAQQSTEADLLREIEALLPEFREAAVAWDTLTRQRRRAEANPPEPATPSDTVQVGPIRILTLRGEGEIARGLFEEVWREDFGAVPESPSLVGYLFIFQWRTRLRDFALPYRINPREQILSVEMSRVWARTREQAKSGVRAAIARVLSQDIALQTPIRGAQNAFAYPDDEAVYRQLALARSGASRGCLAGDPAACLAALGMGLGSESRLAQWFTPQERVEMVGEAAAYRRVRGEETSRVDRDDPLVRGCIERTDVSACDRVLAQLAWMTEAPRSSDLRSHFLWFAVRTGGREAWERMLQASQEPPPELLAHVANVPLEELAARWHAQVMAAHPDVQAGLGGVRIGVFLWTLIFAAFAMRSTRWRLA